MIKVTGLSADNVRALKLADEAHVTDGVTLHQVGATFAVFDASTAADAQAQVQADMDHLRATSSAVRQTRYQALIAVRNKLRTAATTAAGHHHVKAV